MDTGASTLRGKSRRTLDRLFVDHPRSLGETYREHQGHALSFGLQMMLGGAACVIHSFIPALFPRTASATIRRLHQRMAELGRLDDAGSRRHAAIARRASLYFSDAEG